MCGVRAHSAWQLEDNGWLSSRDIVLLFLCVQLHLCLMKEGHYFTPPRELTLVAVIFRGEDVREEASFVR